MRYSDKVLAQGEAYEDSPERAQDSLAEALAVLKKTADAARDLQGARALLALHRLDAATRGGLTGKDRFREGIDLLSAVQTAGTTLDAALAKADALLARGGK